MQCVLRMDCFNVSRVYVGHRWLLDTLTKYHCEDFVGMRENHMLSLKRMSPEWVRVLCSNLINPNLAQQVDHRCQTSTSLGGGDLRGKLTRSYLDGISQNLSERCLIYNRYFFLGFQKLERGRIQGKEYARRHL